MATDAEFDAFLEECEQRLSCRYVRPHCTKLLPDATRLTRYLFPMSPQAVGLHSPNLVLELLLVANISSRTFWNEVEEAFEDTAHKITISKTRNHPSGPVTHQSTKTSYLLVETSRGPIVSLEYYQLDAAQLVDSNGYISSTASLHHTLMNRARRIQRLAALNADEVKVDSFHQNASRFMSFVHDCGILSRRLNLLTLEQLIDVCAEDQDFLSTEQVTGSTLLARLSDLAMNNTAVERLISVIPSSPPDSPSDGLAFFRNAYTSYILIQINYWAPGSGLLFADAFFDVVASVQHDLQKDDSYIAHAWPYYLTERPTEDGVVFYLIGVQRSGSLTIEREGRAELQKLCSTEKIYEITQDLLGYQFNVGKNGESNECYIQATLVGSGDEIFGNLDGYWQTHVAPVRGLSLAALSQLEGNASNQESRGHDHKVTIDDKDAPSTSFRPGKKVLDQLRWDPKFAGSRSYEVGYEDRFTNALLWLPIEDWVQTTEEDEFIPLHRIRQFRKIATKEIVWDRARRLDKLK